jgi:hypothetical protein
MFPINTTSHQPVHLHGLVFILLDNTSENNYEKHFIPKLPNRKIIESLIHEISCLFLGKDEVFGNYE